MKRSTWKTINLKFKENPSKKKDVLIVSRSAEISYSFVGLTVKVHDGKELQSLTISESMVQHKFGEFVQTRKDYVFFARKKKKKKKK